MEGVMMPKNGLVFYNHKLCEIFLFILSSGRLPALRRKLKEVPASFRKQLSNNMYRTCRMVLPYLSSIFRTGVQRFMYHNIPHDVVARSSVELLLVLIDAERKVQVSF